MKLLNNLFPIFVVAQTTDSELPDYDGIVVPNGDEIPDYADYSTIMERGRKFSPNRNKNNNRYKSKETQKMKICNKKLKFAKKIKIC